jgi:hypothetical protein
MQVQLRKSLYQSLKIILKSLFPVYLWLAYAEEVEVGSVEDEELHISDQL